MAFPRIGRERQVLGFKCRIKGHAPGERIVRNAGLGFARCTRCGADLVEKDGKWSIPPKGARIVWAPRETIGEAEPVETAAPAEPEAADQRASGDRRKGEDRRKAKGALPAFLRGKDRRSGQRDRRTAFGRRFRG
jgi:uncharacterized Zn finger protein (UPF0148 family)